MALALIAALALTVHFALGLARSVAEWQRGTEPELAAWMTLGYVARAWDVPREALRPLAGTPDPEGKRLTLADIAELRDMPLDALIAEIEATVAMARGAAE